MIRRNHINFCKECRKAFTIHERSVDFCEMCCMINDIHCGEITDIPPEYEDQPRIVSAIMRRYMEYGYE